MNRHAFLHWTITGLMAAFMLMTAAFDVLQSPGALAAFAHLGYPLYLVPFIGMAKIAGVLAVVFPSPSRLKEWAYAGLVIDLTGALYSHLSVGDPPSAWIFAVIGLALVTGSYLSRVPRTRSAGGPHTTRSMSLSNESMDI
jgi:hypothetical protein